MLGGLDMSMIVDCTKAAVPMVGKDPGDQPHMHKGALKQVSLGILKYRHIHTLRCIYIYMHAHACSPLIRRS